MTLRDSIIQETIADLALRPVVRVHADQTVRQVCEAMSEQRLGAAIITDADGRTQGMFNEKLLISLLARKPEGMDEPVKYHMTSNVVCVKPTDSIATLIATMQGRKLRWVCVVDDQGKATALTGLRGVMEYAVDHFPRSVLSQPIRSKLAIEEREGA